MAKKLNEEEIVKSETIRDRDQHPYSETLNSLSLLSVVTEE